MKKPNERVRARMAAEMRQLPPQAMPEGVQPLNPGLLMIERIRANQQAKVRSVVRPVLKSE